MIVGAWHDKSNRILVSSDDGHAIELTAPVEASALLQTGDRVVLHAAGDGKLLGWSVPLRGVAVTLPAAESD